MVGAQVSLDRAREVVTDELGRFAFEGVEAGIRGLRLPPKRFVAVAVAPGETVELELGAEELLDIVLAARRDARPWLEEFHGVVVGTGKLADVLEFAAENGAVRLEQVRPGPHVFLSASGDVVVGDLSTSSATLELGTTPLTVHATPGTRVYIVPAGANDLVEVMAGRAASRTVSAEGVLEYAGLARGRYGIGIDRRGVQLEVELAEEAVEVELE